jgi:hypothetical protein
MKVNPYPVVCTVMFIVSLLICLARIPLALFGFVGWQELQRVGHPLASTVPFEIGTGAAVALFGLLGNIGLLLKQSWGLVLGGLTVVAVLASVAVALWQLAILSQTMNSPAERGGMLTGAGVMLVLRLGLLCLYVLALAKFAQWKKARNMLG